MAQRNLASKRLLKTAADKAQTDSEHHEVERLEIIQDHLEQFWDGIRKAVAEMQPTDEIVLSESNRVAVIECSREELVVQWEGKPRRYRIEAMPMELLSAVAKASFKLTPGTKLVVGSFLAVDAHGDRTEARKLWRKAIASSEPTASCSCRSWTCRCRRRGDESLWNILRRREKRANVDAEPFQQGRMAVCPPGPYSLG